MTDTVAVDCPACVALMELLLTLVSSEWDGGSVSWMLLEERDPGARGACEPTEVQLGHPGPAERLRRLPPTRDIRTSRASSRAA
ncbi:hypothetical protein [Streptomyces sp. NPDC086989]|uniref:hypothetical protein n=1 Tax=Streptomyces sp. NPDC086989 TaxID=3365764 RepID=UPI0037F62F6E